MKYQSGEASILGAKRAAKLCMPRARLTRCHHARRKRATAISSTKNGEKRKREEERRGVAKEARSEGNSIMTRNVQRGGGENMAAAGEEIAGGMKISIS